MMRIKDAACMSNTNVTVVAFLLLWRFFFTSDALYGRAKVYVTLVENGKV